MAEHKPDAVVMAAAKVGGILANDTLPVDFLHENLVVQTNVMESAFRSEVQKLLFLGSSCIYPKHAPQPIPEDALLTGPLEPTNEWYAVAKIAGLKLCQAYRRQYGVDYISAMPTNLYGPGDNFDLTSSHVVPALMRKAHEVKRAGERTLQVWGSGRPMREFLHVDDAADALVWLLKNYSGDGHVNVGSGEDISIGELARTILSVVRVEATVTFDATKPDGTPRKLSWTRRRPGGRPPSAGNSAGRCAPQSHLSRPPHAGLVEQVELAARDRQDVAVLARQPAHDRRADHAAMPGDEHPFSPEIEDHELAPEPRSPAATVRPNA